MDNTYLIDTHCHLHDPEFFDSAFQKDALNRAATDQVRQLVVIGTSHQDSLVAKQFSQSHPGVFWSYGVHPGEVKTGYSYNLAQESFLNHLPIAIGEVGLDYHYPDFDRDQQIKLLEQMLELARTSNLPLIFHVREAFPDFFAVVDNFSGIRGVVHSFTDNKKHLKMALDRDFYIGVNGLATYSTLPTPPLERILLETDAPFLTPEPFRGKINEPAHIHDIADWLSRKLGLDIQTVTRETTKNARRLFNFSDTLLPVG